MRWLVFPILQWLDDRKTQSEIRARYYAQKQTEREIKNKIERQQKQEYLNGFYRDYDKVKK